MPARHRAPTLLAVVQWHRMRVHRAVFWNGLFAPPWPSDEARESARAAAGQAAFRAGKDDGDDPNYYQPTAGDLHRQLHRYFELAGFFTMVAGLLNVLAIYDAWGGPVVISESTKKKKEEEAVEQKAASQV